MIIAKQEHEKRISYQLRFDTMCRELGWLSARDYAVPEERDEYDDTQSIIFLALDAAGNAVGTSRIILPGEIPLPVERHFDLHPRSEIAAVYGEITSAVEISRFIVPPNAQVRRHDITRMLCMSMLRTLLTMGASHAFVSADHRFFRLLRILGIEFEQIGDAKFYMGSKTIPGITNLPLLYETIKRKNPRLYEFVRQKAA